MRNPTLAVLFLLLAAPALAYLDPGPASFFFNILIAAFVGAMFYVRSFLRGLLAVLKGKKRQAQEAQPESAPQAE
ncbi:MAG: hypothetical protein AB1758_17850 [Candidatus Eremiobacterota bacterium]